MPSHKIHILGGVLTYVLAIKLALWASLISSIAFFDYFILLGITLLGSLFPDIDTSSTMQKIFWYGMIPCVPLSLLFKPTFFVLLCIMCTGLLVVRHRTITHRFWFIVATPILFAFILAWQRPHNKTRIFSACLFFIAGALSHRLLDFGPRRFFSKK